MPAEQAKVQSPEFVNGIETEKITKVVSEINADKNNAKWKFRSENHWLGGTLNQSAFKDFYALGEENTSRTTPFMLKADEPVSLSGNDAALNPTEYLLHALTSCLTTSLVAHAAVRGIAIEDLSSSTEGDIDLRGFLGLSEDVRKGYQTIRINMKVKSDAPADQLKELALFSPVYDVVSNSLPVELNIETYS
ncbi:MAG: osmotically inducible protein C [Nitrosomonas sp.]|nr:MAG: osmotically inducible protein C [Nitrosomonas sp.]